MGLTLCNAGALPRQQRFFTGFVIEENGYFYEQYEVINTGYWAWKKMADLLPYDYEYQ